MKKDFIHRVSVLALGGALSSTALHAGGMGPVSRPHDWTGFYLGANAGALWATYSGSVAVDTFITGTTVLGPSFLPYKENLTSFTGGGQIGYNYQTRTNWVIGAEFNFNGESLDILHSVSAAEITSTSVFVAADAYSVSNDWHSSVLGRIGYAWNNWLLYATGGVSIASQEFSANFVEHSIAGVVFPQASGSNTRVLAGGTAGLGLTYALASYIQIGVEGRYTDYGSQYFNLAPVPVFYAGSSQYLFSPSRARVSTSMEEVLVKVNYQFA